MFKKLAIFAATTVFAVTMATPALAATKKAAPKPALKPTALCKDGTLSYSKTHSGTCSGHKGVRIWYK